MCVGLQVAIKILNLHYREVGKREALCLRVLHETSEACHAAIINLYNVFDFMGHFCLVLDLCGGGSLQSFVQPPGSPPGVMLPGKLAARLDDDWHWRVV